MIKFLGNGMTAKVYKVVKHDSSKKPYALKVIDKTQILINSDNKSLDSVAYEIKVMNSLKNNNYAAT